MATKRPTTKPCPKCGEAMGINRGVCPACGHMTRWFKIRFYVGGMFVLIAIFGMILMVYMMINAPAQ